LLMQGAAPDGDGPALANYVINVAEKRKDAVALVSPEFSDVVLVPGSELSNLKGFRNSIKSSTYAILDSGWGYQYDKYNDTYRWIPLNGDIAGLCARTDTNADTWFSPAGLQRGILNSPIKLAYNPVQAQRDELYRIGYNSVVSFPGQGIMLFGDKTLSPKQVLLIALTFADCLSLWRKLLEKQHEGCYFSLIQISHEVNFSHRLRDFCRVYKQDKVLQTFKLFAMIQTTLPTLLIATSLLPISL